MLLQPIYNDKSAILFRKTNLSKRSHKFRRPVHLLLKKSSNKLEQEWSSWISASKLIVDNNLRSNPYVAFPFRNVKTLSVFFSVRFPGLRGHYTVEKNNSIIIYTYTKAGYGDTWLYMLAEEICFWVFHGLDRFVFLFLPSTNCPTKNSVSFNNEFWFLN